MQGSVHTKAHKVLLATISSYLTESGMTQQEWAKRCKRNYKWASAVLTGARGVSAAELPTIAKSLKVTLQKFVERWMALMRH